jgi:phenylpropionate dioxygenase-like ring-hydroxylating dioxygenase large terminal subunit
MADSHALRRGRVIAVRAFGKELVLARGADGVARLFDGHCPHLGAHLGHGGKMVGDLLECPFHGWRFDGQGRCVSMPLGGTIPGRTGLRSWPVREVNDVVMTWFDREGGEPDWIMPEMPEKSLADWTRFWPAKNWIIRTHPQELIENGMDLTHFSHLHSQQNVAADSSGLEIDGPRLTHHTIQHHNLFGIGARLGWNVKGKLDITAHGLGCAVNRANIREGMWLDYCVMFYFLPIDGERVAVNCYFAMRRKGLLTMPLLWMAMNAGGHTIDQDVPIWENKLYRETPRLNDADGPIMQYRKWARQFHESDADRREPTERLAADGLV